MLLSPDSVAVARVALADGVEQRRERLLAAGRERRAQRRRPSRPTMAALHVVGPGRLAWRDVPVPPEPGPDGAVVRPLAVATCDLDRAVVLGATPFPMPFALGHECVAEVVTVGERVRTVAPGGRVVVPFQISCGACTPCRAGSTGNCAAVPPLSMYGFGLAGGHWGGVLTERVAVPFADGMLVALPGGVDPVAAASVADTVCDGYRHIAPHLPQVRERHPDPDVLIVGALRRSTLYAPSLLLYAGQVARALGVRRVRLVDARPHVRDAAERLGLVPLTPAELRGAAPAPLVLAGSGTARGVRIAFDKTAPDGVCSSVGGLHRPARLGVAAAYARNITFRVGRTDARAHIPAVLDMVASGALHPERVVTTRGPLDEAATLLDAHYRGQDVKTVLTA